MNISRTYVFTDLNSADRICFRVLASTLAGAVAAATRRYGPHAFLLAASFDEPLLPVGAACRNYNSQKGGAL